MSETDGVVSNVALNNVTESMSEESSPNTKETEMPSPEFSKPPQEEPVIMEEKDAKENNLKDDILPEEQKDSKDVIEESNNSGGQLEEVKNEVTIGKQDDTTASTNEETLSSDLSTELNKNKDDQDVLEAGAGNMENTSHEEIKENVSSEDTVEGHSEVTKSTFIRSSQSGETANEDTETKESNQTVELSKDAPPIEEETDSNETLMQANDTGKKEESPEAIKSPPDIGIKEEQLPQKESNETENICQDTAYVEKVDESTDIPLQENAPNKKEQVSEIIQTPMENGEKELPASNLEKDQLIPPVEELEEPKQSILQINDQEEKDGSSELTQSPVAEREEVAETSEAKVQEFLLVREVQESNENALQDNNPDKITHSSEVMQPPENVEEKGPPPSETGHILEVTLPVKEVKESKETILLDNDRDPSKSTELIETAADDSGEKDVAIADEDYTPKEEVESSKVLLLEDNTPNKKEESPDLTQKSIVSEENEEPPSLQKEAAEIQSTEVVNPTHDNKKEMDEQQQATNSDEAETITKGADLYDVDEPLLKEEPIVEEPTKISNVDNQENLDKASTEIASEIGEQKENVSNEIEIITQLRNVVSELERQGSKQQCDDKVSEVIEEVGDKEVEESSEGQKEYGSLGVLGASITYAYNKVFG